MANPTSPTELPEEKEFATSFSDAAFEDAKSQDLPGPIPNEKNERDDEVVDDGESKSASLPGGDAADRPPEPPIEQPGDPGKDYSVLNVAQKRVIVVTASFASLFSPLATAIYCAYLRDVLSC